MPYAFPVTYSEHLPDFLQESRTEFEARLAMAAKLFEIGRLSSGQAAELAALAGSSSSSACTVWACRRSTWTEMTFLNTSPRGRGR
jgi:hypothetical protein